MRSRYIVTGLYDRSRVVCPSAGSGDGTRPARPIGLSIGLDAVTKPGDVIILLPSDDPLDGGVTLKPGQSLIGHSEAGRKPAVTNSNAGRNGGNGVVLADDCKVLEVRIERTRTSSPRIQRQGGPPARRRRR
jgi:hypothetical protein